MKQFFFDHRNRLRRPFRISVFLVALLFAEVVVQIAIAIVTIVYLIIAYPELETSDQVLDRLEGASDENVWIIMMIFALPQTVVGLVLVWICRKFLDRESLASTGLQIKGVDCWSTLLIGLLVGAAPIFLVAGTLSAFGALSLEQASSPWLSFVFIVPGLLCAAFFEELVFRGYILRNYLDDKKPIWGLIVSSILFWLLHSMNPSAWQSPWVGINLTLAGVFLSLCYLVSNNLWFPTVVHFAWNFTQGPILGIPVSGIAFPSILEFQINNGAKSWITGGEFGFEASALATLIQLLVITSLGAYWWFVIRQSSAAEMQQTTSSAV